MKLRIEVSEGLAEDEVVIRCAQVNDAVLSLQRHVLGLASPKLTLYKGKQTFYIPLSDILFFETDGECVFAHTAKDAFRAKHRLCELEAMLPHTFARAAKSLIVNTSHIYSVDRSLASSGLIRFTGTHKHVYVSRRYYGALKSFLKGN